MYIVGWTFGDLEGASAGGVDAYVRSYDSNGTHRWTRQFGTSSDDEARGVATDLGGSVYAAGVTFGSLDGPATGFGNAYVRKYRP